MVIEPIIRMIFNRLLRIEKYLEFIKLFLFKQLFILPLRRFRTIFLIPKYKKKIDIINNVLPIFFISWCQYTKIKFHNLACF